MKMIKDLEPDTVFDAVELTIVAKEPPRFLKDDNFTGLRSVAIGRDITGEIKITLWDGESSEIELGDRIRITNGRVQTWAGDKVLSSGKYGHISIIVNDEIQPLARPTGQANGSYHLPTGLIISKLVKDEALVYDDACGCPNCETICDYVDTT